MTHKILHIIAVLFTALAAALILPQNSKNNRSKLSHHQTEADKSAPAQVTSLEMSLYMT